ncbi:ABC-2 transporter component protein [Candidatus Micropelagos thuwalensis]|uniref:ABC-2 transporter component protein n=1 Tax=Candidatus Micropelagius thuwalensis TaxID=1397666 RepID=U2WT67_9PROT|nr:TonB-dependent siderophore receptor [Candidatus Micropelagos thuwalensis]ERL46733.1 ABC-2 transporter component protein [Candidatus Micropelagos thuwalensis]
MINRRNNVDMPTNMIKPAVLITCLITGLLRTEIVSAQSTDEIVVEGKYLFTDQVNALKTPVPILNVPQSLSIITDDDIRQQGFRELGDIVRYTPGVNTSQGEGHRDSIVFRGVRSTADFYLDGVRDDVQYYRSLYNLDQVEILRGPNALLFGRGGTGGIVNRVTKKTTIGENFGAIDIGADSFGAYDVAADYNIATSEKAALRINAHYDALENHRDFYDGDRIGFNPTLKIALSPKTTLDLSYEYADHERFIDRGIPTQNGEPVEAFEKITFGDENINLTTLEAQIFRGLLSHEFSDTMKGNVTVHYGDYEKMYRNLYATGYDGTNVTMDGYLDPTERTNLIVSGNLIKEFNMGDTQHVLLVGLEHIKTENENLRHNTYWSTTGNDKETFSVTRPMDFTVNSAGVTTSVDFTTDLNDHTESDITVTSLLIQDQIDVSETFKIMLGARLDNFDITVDDIDDASSTSREDEEVSPRAGLIFKPQENLSLYASYSESFLPRSGEQFKKLSASASRLDPDVFENFEIGVKWDIRPNLSFTMSYFDSEQTQAVRDSDTGEASEVIGLTVDGIELELKGQLTDQLSIAAGYSNFDGETSSGGVPREIPEYSFSLWSTYQVNEKLGIGLGVTHQGESNIKNNSATPILPDYTRLDLAAYYDIDEDMTLQLNIENLTDELYFPHAHSTHQASVGEPLNARVSIRRNF